jgi:hypothetical protein
MAQAPLFIRCAVRNFRPDRTPYKAYGADLQPLNLCVDIPIEDATQIISADEHDGIVLTLDGLAQIMVSVIEAIDKHHGAYLDQLDRSDRSQP